jgi:beta-galactosidase/beta-glucuronidase
MTSQDRFRATFSLNGAWRYRPDAPQYGFGEALGWSRPQLADDDWPAMDLPACWDLADRNLWGYEGYVWFRRRFAYVPRNGRRVLLRFEGVNYRADVWLDGHSLGAHEGGYTPFELDVTEYFQAAAGNVSSAGANESGQHVLVVRVDNRPLPDRVPGSRLSWFNYGGIYRDVALHEVPAVHLADVSLVPEPLANGDRGPARIGAKAAVRNDGAKPFRGWVRLSADGAPEWTGPGMELAPGEATDVRAVLELPDVAYWSPVQPSLLGVRAELLAETGTVDSAVMRTGVRQLRVSGTRVLLNGKEVKLKGYNRHEDYPTTGRAHDEAVMLADLSAIKASGANFVRCHYPQHRRFNEACDELGLMVMGEIPLWGWGRGSFEDGSPEAVRASALQQLEEMLRRDRNHPCIVIWSVSNETGGGKPEVDETNLALMRRVRELDPSRLVSHVTLQGVWRKGEDPAMAEDDILCLNEYEGTLGHAPPTHTLQDLQAAAHRLSDQLDQLHTRFPDKPAFVTEFGGIGIPGLHGDYLWTEEFYAQAIRAHWEVMACKPWIVGGLLWSWADYPLHPRRQRVYPLGFYGVYTVERRPKVGAAVMAALLGAYRPATPPLSSGVTQSSLPQTTNKGE